MCAQSQDRTYNDHRKLRMHIRHKKTIFGIIHTEEILTLSADWSESDP
jgi:hypothetical protein